MSRRTLILVATAGALLFTSVFVIAAGRRRPRQPVAKQPGPPPLRDPRFSSRAAPTTLTLEQHAALTAARPTYTVQPHPPEPGKTRTKAEQRVLDELSARIAAAAPVPDSRRTYYSWMERPDSPIRFVSWGCLLRHARPIPGGWALELWVMPQATTTNMRVDVYNRFIEEYTLTDGAGLRFIRGYPHPDSPRTPQFGHTGL